MKTKILAITIISFLLTNLQTVFAQDFSPFERSSGYNALTPAQPMNNDGGGTSLGQQRGTTDSNTCPNCGAPLWGGPGTTCPNCDPSTEGKMPISGGAWMLIGLVIAYGLFRRKKIGIKTMS